MTKYFMITQKRVRTNIELIKWLQYFLENDTKKWVIAKEVGTFGLKHWQIRISSRIEKWEDFHADLTLNGFGNCHIEECTDTWEYERKEGQYYTSEDTIEQLQVRFGKLNIDQHYILEITKGQSDREITVWFNESGNVGKSWLCNYLYEKGIGFYVPPTLDSVKGIIQFVASGYNKEPIIVIDIPRSWKWSEQLYTAIESIKDGLIYDTRYSAKTRNIRGVKVLVLTNSRPKLDKLSSDRWCIINTGGAP